MAEHLVCAELARRKLIATTFTHNIPKFDVLVADDQCRTIPIQVKATSDGSWRSSADTWMNIEFDEAKKIQVIMGEKTCATPDLIWVCVVARPAEPAQQADQFFILTEREIQQICISNYQEVLAKYSGQRPRNWRSLDFWWNTSDLSAYENKWETIKGRLKGDMPQLPVTNP